MTPTTTAWRARPAQRSAAANNASAGPGRAVGLLQLSATTALMLGAPGLAFAAVQTPTFTAPIGVSAYRLIFDSADQTTASSSSIADYNAFADTEAAQNAMLPTADWSIIGSTTAVNAVTNIACDATCEALPIYLVDGTTLVATSAAALFDGTTSNFIDEDQFGNANYDYAWTGSNNDGTTAINDELGSDNPIVALSFTPGQQIGGFPVNNSELYSVYAISGEISAVPEPNAGSALLLGGLVVTQVFRRRRRK